MADHKIINDGRSIKNGKLYRRELLFPYNMLGAVNIKWHFGVGVRMDGHYVIIDLADGRGSTPIRKNTFKEFAQGQTVYEINDFNDEDCRSDKEVVKKATEGLRKRKKYSLVNFNCAQFAFYCKLSQYKSIESVLNIKGQEL